MNPALLLALGLLLIAATVPAATLQLSGPPGAVVQLNDRDLGLLPLSRPLQLAPGVYRLECKARGYKDLTQVVILSEPDTWLHVRLRPVRLQRSHAVSGSLVYAGLGQWYSGATFRGWLYFLGETGGLITALGAELQRSNERDNYLDYKARYDQAVDPDDLADWRAKSEKAYRDMEDWEELRNTGLYVALGSYALSLLDAWLLFPSVDVGPGTVPPHTALGEAPAFPSAGMHAAITLGF